MDYTYFSMKSIGKESESKVGYYYYPNGKQFFDVETYFQINNSKAKY